MSSTAFPLLLALLAPFAPFVDGGDSDWPRWRGAHFDDAARAEDVFARPFELVVRWRVPIGTGYSGLSVRGDTAVTLAAAEGSDWVLALDLASGAERWRARIGPAFPGVDGAADGPVSTPTLDADTVYALGPRGELLALALDTGAERWKVDLAAAHGAPQPHWGFTTAPLVVSPGGVSAGVGDLVVVAAGAPDDGAFHAFDAATGAPRWRAGSDAIHYQSPILAEMDGEELVVGAGNSFLFGIEPATGAVRWRVKHGGADFYQQILQPLALGGGELLLKHQRGLSARVVVADGELEELWRSRHLRGNYNLAVHHDGLLFGHGGTFLSCVDAGSGELLWRSRPPGDGWLILVDGHLVVLTKAGSLHVAPASPDGYEERAALQLLEHLTWTPPSFAGGRILARDSLRDAACVEIVPRERAMASGRSAPRADSVARPYGP
jgi:outer membrane protein assembly factor BamB